MPTPPAADPATPKRRSRRSLGALVLVLIATAVGVTVAMFETLYLVMG